MPPAYICLYNGDGDGDGDGELMGVLPLASIYAKAFCQRAKRPLKVIKEGMKKPHIRERKGLAVFYNVGFQIC